VQKTKIVKGIEFGGNVQNAKETTGWIPMTTNATQSAVRPTNFMMEHHARTPVQRVSMWTAAEIAIAVAKEDCSATVPVELNALGPTTTGPSI